MALPTTNKLTGFGSGFADEEDKKQQEQAKNAYAGTGTGITSKAPTLGQFAQANQSRAGDVAQMAANRAGENGVGQPQAVYENGINIAGGTPRQTMGNQYGQGESKVDAAVLANSGQKVAPNTQAFNYSGGTPGTINNAVRGSFDNQSPEEILKLVQRATNNTAASKTPEERATNQQVLDAAKASYQNAIAKQGAQNDANTVNSAIQGNDFGTIMAALRRGYTGEGALTNDALKQQGTADLASKQAGLDAGAAAYKGQSDADYAALAESNRAAKQAADEAAAQQKQKQAALDKWKHGGYQNATPGVLANVKGFVQDLKNAGYTDEEIAKLKKERGLG